ncbi:MAG: TolB-like 6-bladed beta-propeller domain-containing protein [Dysgonamonadaceae bacterium]|nr:TolB-like 6-bladed beta-propeller domain-containing protein [Dysgonamonadaceae bacterium]
MITGEHIDVDSLIGQPSQTVFIEPYLFFYDRFDGKSITMVDVNKKSIYKRFLKEGHGPGEIIPPLKLFVSDDNTLNVFQLQTGALLSYKLSSLLDASILPSPHSKVMFKDRPAILSKAKDGFVGIGMFEKGRFQLYDDDGNDIKVIGSYPFDGDNMNPINRFFRYQGTLCSSPDGKHFAMGSAYCDNLEFWEVTDNHNAVLTHKYESYDVKGSFNGTIRLDDECVMNYKGAYGTNRYCYMLYAGEKYGEKHKRTTGGKIILKFDWNGNYIKTFQTESNIYSFCVDNKDRTIYGITKDETSGFVLKSYKL